MIELARDGHGDPTRGPASDVGLARQRLYGVSSLLQACERQRNIGWVVAARILPKADNDLDGWLTGTLDGLNDLLLVAPDWTGASFDGGASGALADRQAYLGDVDRQLGRWLTGTLPSPDDGLVDVRTKVLEELQDIATCILADWAPPELPWPAPAGDVPPPRRGSVLQHVALGAPDGVPSGAAFARRLAALEVLVAQEHLVGEPGSAEITFERMSAAAITPEATRFVALHTKSDELDPGRDDPDNHLAPNAKLAGNELANFSAFLEDRWRVNDWTWGRMDAVPTLVDLLLGRDRPGVYVDEQERLALIRRRQDQILAASRAIKDDDDKPILPGDDSSWSVGLETLNAPGKPALAAAIGDVAGVAGNVIGYELPDIAPRVGPQLSKLLRFGARRFAAPRRPPGPGGTVAPKSRGLITVLGVVLAALVVAVVWGVAESLPALLIGLASGLVLALVPGALLLWLAIRPRSRGRSAGPMPPVPRR